MNQFITLYFTNDYYPDTKEIDYFERLIGREISNGDGFINVYTRDKNLIQSIIDVIGDYYISEIAY